MPDDDPNTSYLGGYSDKRTSEFSIDRAHSEDCASVNPVAKQAKEKLESIQNQLQAQINSTEADFYGVGEEESLDCLGRLIEEVTECDCDGCGDMGRDDCQFFNPSFNYVDKQGRPTNGLTAEEVRTYVRRDYDRMESLNNQQWCYLGIRADAEVCLADSGAVQRITSGGVWGYESDMAPTDFEEAESEQLAELKTQLLALGFSRRAIAAAFKSIERKNS